MRRRGTIAAAGTLLLALLLPAGCGGRRQTIEAHTLVRDSVTLAATDTSTLHWHYVIETTYIRDTIRSVIERGTLTEARRTEERRDSVIVVVRDTIALAPAPTPDRPREYAGVPIWATIAGILLTLILALFARKKFTN